MAAVNPIHYSRASESRARMSTGSGYESLELEVTSYAGVNFDVNLVFVAKKYWL